MEIFQQGFDYRRVRAFQFILPIGIPPINLPLVPSLTQGSEESWRIWDSEKQANLYPNDHQ